MAHTTYLEIKTDVKGNLGRGTAVDSFLDQWARYAIREITRWRDNFFLKAVVDFSTVVDQQTYTLASDFKSNMKLHIRKTDKWVDLPGPIDIVEAHRRYAPDDSGEPKAWSWFTEDYNAGLETKIKVWPPKPDAIYIIEMDYTRFISDLTADGDINVLTSVWPDLLVAWMTCYAFRHYQEWGDADKWKAEAMRIMQDLHAKWVAQTLGRDFTFRPREDALGHGEQERGLGTFLVIK